MDEDFSCIALMLSSMRCILWDMDRLSVENPFNGAPVYYLAETDSTMLDAAALAAAGTPSGTVVTAGFQRAGRGRYKTRRWISAPGEGLLFTLILDHAAVETGPALTPLLAGLGVARYVEKATGRLSLVKWPNDVLCEGGKVAGVLCESRDGRVYVGVGINCLQHGRRPPVPAGAAFPPVCLSALGASGIRPLSILGEALAFLQSAFSENDPISEIERRLYLRGCPVVVISGAPDTGEKIYVTLEGLGASGQLIVRDSAAGIVSEIYSGELLAL